MSLHEPADPVLERLLGASGDEPDPQPGDRPLAQAARRARPAPRRRRGCRWRLAPSGCARCRRSARRPTARRRRRRRAGPRRRVIAGSATPSGAAIPIHHCGGWVLNRRSTPGNRSWIFICKRLIEQPSGLGGVVMREHYQRALRVRVPEPGDHVDGGLAPPQQPAHDAGTVLGLVEHASRRERHPSSGPSHPAAAKHQAGAQHPQGSEGRHGRREPAPARLVLERDVAAPRRSAVARRSTPPPPARPGEHGVVSIAARCSHTSRSVASSGSRAAAVLIVAFDSTIRISASIIRALNVAASRSW